MESIITTITHFATTHFVEILGAIIGLIYLYYEYKASKNLWWAGVVMSLFYIYIFFTTQCYAWAATYLYYLFANIYGFIAWKRREHENHEGEIVVKNLTLKKWLLVTLATILITGALYPILYHYAESSIPLSESVSTALSVVATWLLTKKYRQHWILWLIVNVIYTVGSITLQSYPTAFLFFIYSAVSFLGYIRWKKLEKNNG